MKIRFEKIVFCLLILIYCFISPVVADGAEIVRDASTTEPGSDSEFTITLKISGTDVAGIVEYIPEGFTYVGSEHPEDQVSQSGQNIIFSVIGETEINYQVMAPSSGEGLFTGVWYDPMGEVEGAIADTEVSVNSEIHSTQSSVNILSSEEETQDEKTETTPFVGLTASIAILIVTGHYLRRH